MGGYNGNKCSVTADVMSSVTAYVMSLMLLQM